MNKLMDLLFPDNMLKKITRNGWKKVEDLDRDLEVYELRNQRLIYDSRTDEVLEIYDKSERR